MHRLRAAVLSWSLAHGGERTPEPGSEAELGWWLVRWDWQADSEPKCGTLA